MPPASRGASRTTLRCLTACLLLRWLDCAQGSRMWLEWTSPHLSDGHSSEHTFSAALSGGHNGQNAHEVEHRDTAAQPSQVRIGHHSRENSAAQQDATAARRLLPDQLRVAISSAHAHASRRLQDSAQSSGTESLHAGGDVGADHMGSVLMMPASGTTGDQPLDPVSGEPSSFPGETPQLRQQRALAETAAEHAASAQQAAADTVLQPAEAAHPASDGNEGSNEPEHQQQQQQQQHNGPEASGEGAGGGVEEAAVPVDGTPQGGSGGPQDGTWWGAGGHKKKSAPVATLAGGEEDEWWTRVSTDTSKCGIEDAGKATPLGTTSRESGDACEAECRVTEGCNAWFFCEDDRGCYDWQTQLTVGRGFCVLMAASARPQPEPQMQDVVEPFDFFSYQAGYLKAVAGCNPDGGGLPSQTWQRADWLNHLSIANKQDFARLQGFRFLFTHVKDERPKIRVIEHVLNMTAAFAGVDYVLWIEQNALVVNPAFVFPYKRYRTSSKDIIMYGELKDVLDGDGAFSNPGVMLINNTAAARRFFRTVRVLKDDPKRMDEGLQRLKRTDTYHGSGRTYRNAMAYLFASNPDKHLANVFLESDFCISCFFEGADLEAPTMFITHFTGTAYCNEFSLASDDPNGHPFNDVFVEQYRLGRCKHTKALSHAEPRKIVTDSTSEGSSVSLQAVVTLPGRFNIKGSAAACRHSCRAAEDCNAWIYCWRPGGCDDGREYHQEWYPYQACELYDIPENAPLDFVGRGPGFSSFSAGFMPKPQEPKRRYSVAPMLLDRFSRPQHTDRPPKEPNLVIVTAIPADPCQFPIADLINKLSVVNKQDYAHLHGFELHVSSDVIDPNVTAGNWNKETMILKTLEETPASDAEWIMWVDIDTVIADMQVLPRFDEYDGYDLVVWGDRAKLMEGNLNEGINCGVLLVRNTDWAREFFADVGQYAYMPKEELMSVMRPILEKEVFPLVTGFYDTPFITWLLKTQDKYSSKVFFEDQLGINRHWLGMNWGAEDVETLIIHYAGCTYCAPPVNKLSPEVIEACSSEFFKAYTFSKCNLDVGYRSTLPDGTRNVSYLRPDCEYDAVDLSSVKIRLGE